MAMTPDIAEVTTQQWVLLFLLAVLTWFSAVVTYRLYLGPLAKFPGSRLAALTGWYETYFECYKRGRYWVEIEKMHEKYGPIVRISPWEIHINDPDWNESYKVSNRVDKYHWYYKFVGSSDAGFGTSDHELHRIRRKAQQNYFTLDAVTKYDPTPSTVPKLMNRLKEFKGTGKPASLSNAFRSLATDVVTEYSFHKSSNLLSQPDFAAAFHRTVRDFPEIGLWHRHFGLILDILDLIPRWLTMLINPAGIDVLDFFNNIGAQTKEIVADYQTKLKGGRKINGNTKLNVIHQMLSSDELPAKDKSIERLALEVRTFVGAGTETTGHTLSTTTYYLLANPEKAERLKEEIEKARSQSKPPLRYQDLVQLPYLNAVILEGLRISTPVSGRLPRLSPTALTYTTASHQTYTIPAYTPISTSQKLIHDNPTLFPSPREFLPERWLVALVEKKRLEKYVQAFGRGSRSCLGINLANSELYTTIATLFSTPDFSMSLYETTEIDITQAHDFFSPFPVTDEGVRVLIH